MSTYEIKLPQFEGPFDLLLFFIERDELDVYDIPISKIAKEFLDYIHHTEILDIEVASEFILVAATLMRIKAKLLLPRKELDEEGNEIDPRDELVRKLLEYKSFKSVVQDLKQMEEDRAKFFKRGNIDANLKWVSGLSGNEAELHSLTMYKLMNAFQSVLKQYEQEKNKIVHTVIKYPFTLGQQKEFILKKVKPNEHTSFIVLFDVCETKIHAIFTFLALLELIQLKTIALKLGKGINNFWLKLN